MRVTLEDGSVRAAEWFRAWGTPHLPTKLAARAFALWYPLAGAPRPVTKGQALGDKRMHLEVDEGLCTACGLCEERAPENVVMDDDEVVARVAKQPVGKAESANCTEAIEYCPTGGLTATTSDISENAA